MRAMAGLRRYAEQVAGRFNLVDAGMISLFAEPC